MSGYAVRFEQVQVANGIHLDIRALLDKRAEISEKLAALDLHLRLDQPHSVIPDEIARIGALPPPDGYAPPDMAPVRPPTYRPLMARPDEHCGRSSS